MVDSQNGQKWTQTQSGYKFMKKNHAMDRMVRMDKVDTNSK